VTTVHEVAELAKARYGRVGVAELGRVYAALPDAEPRIARALMLTPAPIAGFATGTLLANSIKKIGPAPADLLRINIYDPYCGIGMFLVDGARRLADAYARRLTGDPKTAGQVTAFVLPQVILTCVYGMDTDPLAVDLARLALCLQTDGQLTPQALERNIVCRDYTSGEQPPAKQHRTNSIDMVPASRTATLTGIHPADGGVEGRTLAGPDGRKAMQANRRRSSGDRNARPTAATMAVGGQTVIGVCWQPGHRSPTPILGQDRPVVDGRFGVQASFGDSLRIRSPNHYEWHTLAMRTGEPAADLDRASGLREVFRGWLIGIMPTGSTMEVASPDGPPRVYGEDAFCKICGEVETPDPHTPRWRQLVEDVHADLAAGRLRPGDELPTTGQLAVMYRCSESTVRRALRHLINDGVVVGRPGWGRFITTATQIAEE
jgi:Bacterial regulatory proteins, gntR family